MKKLCQALRGEAGFTLTELIVVMGLLGIVTAMFSTTMSTTVRRHSEVNEQNILQTEVRSSINRMVEDLRSATNGDSVVPILSSGINSITVLSPDRLAPNKMRKVKYFLQGTDCATSPCVLMRQTTESTNSDGPPWTWPATDPAPQQVVASVMAPAIAPQPDKPQSGWAAGQIFKYCGQNPSDMAPLVESEAPDPITWTCTDPGGESNIRTIVVRAAVSATPRSARYTYGAVATLRWNAS